MGKSTNDGTLKYYKSTVAGLSIQLSEGDNEDRSIVGTDELSFTPVEFFDEKRGDRYKLGFLATDDDWAQQILEEDANVTEIKKTEYEEAVKPATEETS